MCTKTCSVREETGASLYKLGSYGWRPISIQQTNSESFLVTLETDKYRLEAPLQGRAFLCEEHVKHYYLDVLLRKLKAGDMNAGVLY